MWSGRAGCTERPEVLVDRSAHDCLFGVAQRGASESRITAMFVQEVPASTGVVTA